MHDVRSRMRATRTSGSVGGSGSNARAYPTVGWLACETLRGRASRRLRNVSPGLGLAAWVVAVVAELPFHFMPTVPRPGRPTLGIIADSITAGMGTQRITRWPDLFADHHGVTVRDHSQMGATVASARRQ